MRRKLLLVLLVVAGIACCVGLARLVSRVWRRGGYPLMKRYVEVDINSGRFRYRRVYLGVWERATPKSSFIFDTLKKGVVQRSACWRIVYGPPTGLFVWYTSHAAFMDARWCDEMLMGLWAVWDEKGAKGLDAALEKTASDILALWQASGRSSEPAAQYMMRLVEEGSPHAERVIPLILSTRVCEERPIGQGYETILRHYDGTIMEVMESRDGGFGGARGTSERFTKTSERMRYLSGALDGAIVSGKWSAPVSPPGPAAGAPMRLVVPPEIASTLKEPYPDGAALVTREESQRQMLDAWGNPVLYLPSSGSTERGRGSIVSLGPDGKWEGGRGDDMVMSISDRPRLLPPPLKDSRPANP